MVKINHKIVALIVTFNPDMALLKKNINAVCKNLNEDYLIVDNGSKNVKLIIKEFGNKVIQLNKNCGIAAAQNIGFGKISRNAANWVLLLDQDSVIPDGMITKIVNMNEFSKPDTGIISAAYLNKDYVKCGIIQKSDVISSGSLVKIDAWKYLGGMDERLFIDYVDFDFNIRLILAGYKIYQNTDIVIQHQLGEIIPATILTKLLALNRREGVLHDYSPIRLYYFYRNSIIVRKRYPDQFLKTSSFLLLSLRRAREIIFFKKPRLEKFSAAMKGTIEGLRYIPNQDRNFIEMMEKINEKINFILPATNNTPIGGYKIIYQYANALSRKGYIVTLNFLYSVNPDENGILWQKVKRFRHQLLKTSWPSEKISWFEIRKCVKLNFNIIKNTKLRGVEVTRRGASMPLLLYSGSEDRPSLNWVLETVY